MTSSKKIAANQSNSKNSTGPKDTSLSRLNAIKHGLGANGLTKLDNLETYQRFHAELTTKYQPVGAIEEFLVHSAALDAIRWQRAQDLEASFITSVLDPPVYEKDHVDLTEMFRGELISPGTPAALSVDAVQYLLTIQRYEVFFSNRFYRTMHELERSLRIRRGERVPAPMAADLSIHANTNTPESPRAALEKSATATAVDIRNAQESQEHGAQNADQEFLEPLNTGLGRLVPADAHVAKPPSELPPSISSSNKSKETSEPPPIWQNIKKVPIWSQ